MPIDSNLRVDAKGQVHQPWCQKTHTRRHPQIELCWCQTPQSASLGAAYTQTRTGLSWNRRLPDHWSEVLPNCTGRAQMLLWKSLSEGSQVVTGSHHWARQMQDSKPCISPKKSAVSDKVNIMCQAVTSSPSVVHCMRTLSSNDAHYSVWKELNVAAITVSALTTWDSIAVFQRLCQAQGVYMTPVLSSSASMHLPVAV